MFLLTSSVLGCEISSDDDDGDDQTRDGAIVGRDAASAGRDAATAGRDAAVVRDSGVRDGAIVTPGEDEDAGGSGREIDCDASNGGIDLPRGFCALVYADGLGRARQLAVSPAGDLYVAVANAPDGSSEGEVIALRDSDGDLRADRRETFGETGGNGILWHDGKLYFAPNDRVLRYDLPNGTLVPSSEPATIVSGLPDTPDHYYKAVVIDGTNLYVNIGSASNACQVNNRALESPGVDPCPELDTRAGVWRFNAAQLNQQQPDGSRFVRGARNFTAITLHPSDGALYAVNNGRDQLYENWPSLYTMADDMRLPSEELVRLQEGADYGWPYCYHDEQMGHKVLAPEYGGDRTMVGRCVDAEEPIGVFPAHWAALSMLFYTGDQFPERYRGGTFVAFHGSRFEPQAPQADVPGYNVVFQPMRGGTVSGPFEEFATGFAGTGRPLPDQAAHRPVGLAVAPDGSLYVSDDVGGRIWRIFYVGDE